MSDNNRPNFVTRCSDCGWKGSIDDVDDALIEGVPSMPSGRRDMATVCPDCGTTLAALRMRPDGNDYTHTWERV